MIDPNDEWSDILQKVQDKIDEAPLPPSITIAMIPVTKDSK